MKRAQFCIKYSICDLICDVIDPGKIDASDKVLYKNQGKKLENMEIKDFFT